MIRYATTDAVEAFQGPSAFGAIIAGARADLLVSAGNALKDITVMTRPDENLLAIITEGRFDKDAL